MPDVTIHMTVPMVQGANYALSNATIKDSRKLMRDNKACRTAILDTCVVDGTPQTVKEADLTLETSQWEYIYECAENELKKGVPTVVSDCLLELFEALEKTVPSLKDEAAK